MTWVIIPTLFFIIPILFCWINFGVSKRIQRIFWISFWGFRVIGVLTLVYTGILLFRVYEITNFIQNKHPEIAVCMDCGDMAFHMGDSIIELNAKKYKWVQEKGWISP